MRIYKDLSSTSGFIRSSGFIRRSLAMGSQSHHKGAGKLYRASEASTLPEPPMRYQPDWLRIPASSLSIIWGRDPRYWRIPSEGKEGSVELLQVCWLEVNSSIDCKDNLDVGKYKIRFVVSLKPDAFGWNGSPVYLMARVGKSPFKWKSADLSRDSDSKNCFEIPDDLTFEVTPDNLQKNEKLTFGLYEIWRGRWKGGLVIHDVIISPL